METSNRLRKTLALVFCDIAGTTRLIAQEGDLAVSTMLGDFVEHAGRLSKEHHCLLIKFIGGDGFLAAFETVGDVVPFIFSIQSLLAQQTTLIGRQLAFRFSLHVGDVLYIETSYGWDVYGTDVNVAAHMNRLAEPGQIVISQAALKHLPSEQQALAGSSEHGQIKGEEIEFRRVNLVAS